MSGRPTVAGSELLGRRLARQFLTAPGPDPATVVGAMCGAHSQIPTAGDLSIGIRLAGATRAEVRTDLIRTYGPRGTVHLLPVRDLPMWFGALSAVPRSVAGLDPDQVDAVVAGVGAALAGAELTLAELDEAVGDLVGAWAVERTMPAFGEKWPRWRSAIAVAAARGALCFGAGRTVTYTRPPAADPLPDGPERLLRAYLWSYGPARPEDFARWLNAPLPWAAALFDGLDEVPGFGWVLPGDTDFPPAAPAGPRLLPYFDAYGVGSHPRSLVFPGRAAERALHRNQAGNYPLLLVDGVVAGVWHARRAGRHLDLTVEPLAEVRPDDLAAEAARIAAFDALTPRLTIGPITTGPHA